MFRLATVHGWIDLRSPLFGAVAAIVANYGYDGVATVTSCSGTGKAVSAIPIFRVPVYRDTHLIMLPCIH